MTTTGTSYDMSDGDFAKLRAIVHKTTGITIGETRKNMLISRLRRRLRELNDESFSSYIKRLSSDPEEMQELTNRVTTNETYFYRTPRVWEYFQNEFIPEFLAQKKNRALRIWSGAASTGEEAHTIGVLMEEQRLSQTGFEYSVLGTDISSQVLEKASEGIYVGRSIAKFRNAHPQLFAKHMTGNEAKGYMARPEIRNRLKFKLHNLLTVLKDGGPFDAIFLRNVLIYFSDEDQETILRHVHNRIQPDGVLFIGESETLTKLNTGFEQIAPIIYKPASIGQRGNVNRE